MKKENKAEKSLLGQFVYIRVTEVTKRRTAEVCDGVLLKKDKETFTAILQGPENESRVFEREFDIEDWVIAESTKEKVQQAWDLGEIEAHRELLKAEFNLKLAQNRFDETKQYMEKYLK